MSEHSGFAMVKREGEYVAYDPAHAFMGCAACTLRAHKGGWCPACQHNHDVIQRLYGLLAKNERKPWWKFWDA